MIDENLQKKLRERYNPDGSALRKAQLRMLDMLSFLDKICSEHNLTYWLSGGTFLGAVRHGGFIPWDNDTDICMPREDMIKLEKILSQEKYNDFQFQLQCASSDPGFFEYWDVLRDTKSEYLIDAKIHQRRKYKGIQVDIFPVERGINPNFSKIARWLNIRMNGRWAKRNIPNAILSIPDFLIRRVIFPTFRIFKDKSNLDRLHYGYGQPWLGYYDSNQVFPLSEYKFEDKTFKGPANYDAYLTRLYGNWNSLPPENNRSQATHTSNIKFY